MRDCAGKLLRGLSPAALLTCLLLCVSARAAEPITLRYGQNAASTGSLSSLPLTVAERKGFFVREGIHLAVVPITGDRQKTTRGGQNVSEP